MPDKYSLNWFEWAEIFLLGAVMIPKHICENTYKIRVYEKYIQPQSVEICVKVWVKKRVFVTWETMELNRGKEKAG